MFGSLAAALPQINLMMEQVEQNNLYKPGVVVPSKSSATILMAWTKNRSIEVFYFILFLYESPLYSRICARNQESEQYDE